MSSPTVVLITGVNRGIGRAVLKTYLSRPNHVVIGSVQDANTAQVQKQLHQLPTAEKSRLILVSIEGTSPTDPKAAVKDIKAAGVEYIDIVIANAGISPPPASLDVIEPEVITETVKINTISSILLFQAVKELLLKSSTPKWVSISSAVGSIGQTSAFLYHYSAYGISKAAQNWFTATIHASLESIVAFAAHPGFVQTDMGNAAAKASGIPPPLTTAEESAAKLLHTIDIATRKDTSGKFIDIITGKELAW